eukprot:6023378-Lingulodinium_polyedra.AAC.1
MQRAISMLRAELDSMEAAQVEPLAAEATRASAASWARRGQGQSGEATAPRAQWSALVEGERVAPAGGAEQALASSADAGRGPFNAGNDGADALPDQPGDGETRLIVTNVQRQLSILVDNTRLR